MKKWVRVAITFALGLVVVASGLAAGCSSGQAELQMPAMEISQYLLGTTVDFNEATLNKMAEVGGEAYYKFGLMKAIYPTVFDTNKDAVAQQLFPPPYKVIKSTDNASVTTYSMLTVTDQQIVDGAIFNTKLSAAEQNIVLNALAEFFNLVEADLAAAKTPSQTSAYAILQGLGTAAAAAWAADVGSGMDYADRFFVHSVKQYVTIMPDEFEIFWAAVGYPGPTYPTDNNTAVEAVARLAGEASFKSGTAGAMYPTQQEQKAQQMYGKSYSELNALLGETWKVDAEVYLELPSAFGTGAAADAMREAMRDATVASMKADYGLTFSADNYTLLRGVEKAMVDQALGAALDKTDECGDYILGIGPHLERDYIDLYAAPGAVLGWGAEMTDTKPLNQNIAYLTLKDLVSVSAANGWKTDVEAGLHPRQAFYRWLAKEGMSEMASASPLIQMSMVEFYVKVTNPNDYLISLDRMNVNCQVDVSGQKIDAAKQSVGEEVWVPADESLIVRIQAPVKTSDVIMWAVVAGNDPSTAQQLAANLWSEVQAGTADWTVTIETQASNESGDHKTETYVLQWVTS